MLSCGIVLCFILLNAIKSGQVEASSSPSWGMNWFNSSTPSKIPLLFNCSEANESSEIDWYYSNNTIDRQEDGELITTKSFCRWDDRGVQENGTVLKIGERHTGCDEAYYTCFQSGRKIQTIKLKYVNSFFFNKSINNAAIAVQHFWNGHQPSADDNHLYCSVLVGIDFIITSSIQHKRGGTVYPLFNTSSTPFNVSEWPEQRNYQKNNFSLDIQLSPDTRDMYFTVRLTIPKLTSTNQSFLCAFTLVDGRNNRNRKQLERELLPNFSLPAVIERGPKTGLIVGVVLGAVFLTVLSGWVLWQFSDDFQNFVYAQMQQRRKEFHAFLISPTPMGDDRELATIWRSLIRSWFRSKTNLKVCDLNEDICFGQNISEFVLEKCALSNWCVLFVTKESVEQSMAEWNELLRILFHHSETDELHVLFVLEDVETELELCAGVVSPSVAYDVKNYLQLHRKRQVWMKKDLPRGSSFGEHVGAWILRR